MNKETFTYNVIAVAFIGAAMLLIISTLP